VMLLAARTLHVQVPWLAFLLPALLYSFFLFGIYRLAKPLKRDPLWFALLFSPAALPFLVLNGFSVGYRKETLVLAGLVAAIFLLKAGVSDTVLALNLSGIFAVIVLSHEAMIVCLPYFFSATVIQFGSLRRAAKICAGPFLVAGVLAVVVSRYPGGEAVARGICSSVGGQWVESAGPFPGADRSHDSLCSGSIAWLTVSLKEYHQQVVLRYLRMYVIRIALAALPPLLVLWQMYRMDRLRFEVRVIAAIALLCFVGSLGLFYSTIDWGRWIYMQNICLLLVILQLAQRAPSLRMADMEGASTPSPSPWQTFSLALLTLVFCMTWSMPVAGQFKVRSYLQAERVARHEIDYRIAHRAEMHLGLFGEPGSTLR
jgi:hypothetical protein